MRSDTKKNRVYFFRTLASIVPAIRSERMFEALQVEAVAGIDSYNSHGASRMSQHFLTPKLALVGVAKCALPELILFREVESWHSVAHGVFLGGHAGK